MEESNISKCRDCGGLEVRKEDGYFPGSKNKRFVNAEGLLWNGRKCPKCQKLHSKSNIKTRRAKSKEANAES